MSRGGKAQFEFLGRKPTGLLLTLNATISLKTGVRLRVIRSVVERETTQTAS